MPMNSAATAILNKIRLRDPALAARITNDVATGNGKAWITDADQAVNVKHYITAREWQTLYNGTTFSDGKTAPVGSAWTAGPAAGATAAAEAVKSLNPLAGLFQAHIWLRVAEVGLGVILIAVGVAKLTNAVPIATKVAGAVAKMPIPV